MMRADAYCVFQLHIVIVPHGVSVNVIVADSLGIPALSPEVAFQLAGMSQGCVAWDRNAVW